MRFHYVPSTYRGRKFGKGFCGGAYRGCARICGGSLGDNAGDTPGPVAVPVNIPVEPAQIQQNLLDFPNITPEMIERARTIIALAEATGKAQPITKKEAGIWSGIKNIGSKIWSGAKAVASNPLVQTAASMAAPMVLGAVAPALSSYIPKALDSVGRYAYNKLDPIYHQEAIENKSALGNLTDIKDNVAELATKGVSNAVGAVAAAPGAIYNTAANLLKNGWNRWWRSGSGYRGGKRARLRKGSPEAKAYMARLRAMRGRKKRSGRGYGGMLHPGLLRMPMPNLYKNFRGSGYRGGMFPGVKIRDLVDTLRNLKGDPDDTKVGITWRDNNGNERTTNTTKGNIKKMIQGTMKMKNYYKLYDAKGNQLARARTKAEEDAFRKSFIEKNRGRSAWPYQKMTNKRYKKMLSTLRRTQNEWKDVKDYWDARTANGTSDFYKKWLAFNYYQPDAEENEFSKQTVRTKNAKKMRNIISQTRLIRMKKEGLITDPELAALIPKFFTRIYTSSKIKTEPYKYIYPKRKKKIPVSIDDADDDDDMSITLSPPAAAAAKKSVNGSAAPPPPSILPNDGNLDMYNINDDDDALNDVGLGGIDDASADFPIINEIRNKIAAQTKRAQRIKDAPRKAKILNDLDNLSVTLDEIEEGIESGENEDAHINAADRRIKQITKSIGETLKLQ